MFKKTLFSLLCLGVMSALSYNFFSIGGDDLPGVSSYYDGPLFNNESDSGVSCSSFPAGTTGISRDDGTFENGYRSVSTGDSTTMVHKLVLGPGATITAICWTWTALSPSGNLTHNLVVYDTTGAGDSPGSLVGKVTGVVSTGVALFPAHSRYRSAANIGPLPNRSYFVGVQWNNNPILPFFSSADENSTNTMGPGYQRVTTTFPPVWQNINIPFPAWDNWSYRVEITTGPGPVGTVTICRNNVNKTIPDLGTVRDTINVNLPPLSRILQYVLRIDTADHTWDADTRWYLTKGVLGGRVINEVGGSGDNFRGTNVTDSNAANCQIGQAACNTPPFTGTFRPSLGFAMTSFLNTTPNEPWILTITDTVGGDSGLLKAWCVIIRYDNLIGVGGTSNEVPTQYSLSQNYPNPFNPSTTIEFALPKSENVKLRIYDILGKEVYSVINGKYDAGNHKVIFDMANFSSGIYFYKLEAGDFSATKKMMLIK